VNEPPAIRLQPRYRRQVTPDHVGQRVTVRHLIEDGERGAVPTDVVGVLTAWEDDVMTIERRDGEVVLVPAGTVLASRVVAVTTRSAPE
jgi:N-acetylglutamate synthase